MKLKPISIKYPGVNTVYRIWPKTEEDAKWLQEFVAKYKIPLIKVDKKDWEVFLAHKKERESLGKYLTLTEILNMKTSNSRVFYVCKTLNDALKKKLKIRFTKPIDKIPKGSDCGTCPYRKDNGLPIGPGYVASCELLQIKSSYGSLDLLWDEVKSCSINI